MGAINSIGKTVSRRSPALKHCDAGALKEQHCARITEEDVAEITGLTWCVCVFTSFRIMCTCVCVCAIYPFSHVRVFM